MVPPGGRDLLRAPHAVATVVAEVAVAVANGDGAAVVATGGVELEAGELLAAGGVDIKRGAVAVDPQLSAGPFEQVAIDLLRRGARVAVRTGAGSTAGRASSGTRM